MNAVALRKTSDERRDEIVEAAFAAFAQSGLTGTSTEDIARMVGVSQPYIFRLFGTKKQLFLAAIERCFEQTEDVFRRAVESDSHPDPKHRIGHAYAEMIQDRRKLMMQMQAYVACDDDDVRRVVQQGFARLVDYIQSTTGTTPAELSQFFGKGMLLNVMASMQALDSEAGWAATIREGCMSEID